MQVSLLELRNSKFSKQAATTTSKPHQLQPHKKEMDHT